MAGAASSTDEAEIRQRIEDFFAANYPPDRLGITFTPEVTVNGDEVHVSGKAEYDTMFLKVVGVDSIDVSAETTVIREVQGIEVALVLDVTGSMSGTKIESLRTAANNFVYIMHGIDIDQGSAAAASDLSALETRDSTFIKIGVVPYSTSVNVGPYGLGLNPDGSDYGTPFVNNPHNLTYSAGSSTQWGGCVLAADYPLDTQDHEGPWDMYRYCRDAAENRICDGKWKYNYYTHQNEWVWNNRSPNYVCPTSPILPLTSSAEKLRNEIDSLQAGGHTYGNFGMVWGYRVISPEFPFEEAHDWTNEYWKKAVIMMTDGENTIHPYYSAYGPTPDDGLETGDQDARFLEVCNALKEKGVTVYTVTFTSGAAGAKATYEQCATSPDYYFNAPEESDLVDVFEEISRQLSNLHIKG